MGFTKYPKDYKCISSVNLTEWMQFGYFPNGLPPAFTTTFFAKEVGNILEAWKKNCGGSPRNNGRRSSRPTHYGFPKRIHANSRRDGYLMNPVHQTFLTEKLCLDWEQIKEHIDASEISLSKLILDKSRKRKRYLEKVQLHKQLGDYQIDYCACNQYVLYVDLQGFYPSIYTHSLEWALVGKANVKSNRTYGKPYPNPALQKLGAELDTLLRYTKEAETKGIPIGPDTSYVVSEIIGVAIDQELVKRLNDANINFNGYRHVDDMVFYTLSRKDAEMLLEILHEVLREYHLQINEGKTRILQLPEDFIPLWTSELATFSFEYNSSRHYKKSHHFNNLRQFLTKAFQLQRQEEAQYVLRYALQILRPFKGKRNLQDIELDLSQTQEWNLLESFLAQSLIFRPDNIVHIHDILVWYKRKGFCLSNFPAALHNFLINTPIQHDYEIAWGLWVAKALKICLNEKVSEKLKKTKSPIVKLLALDLSATGNLKSLNTSGWQKELERQPGECEDHWLIRLFYGSDWILVYEACMQGWLGLSKSIVEKDRYFRELAKRDVRFFIHDRTLDDPEIDAGLSYLGVGGMAGVTGYATT